MNIHTETGMSSSVCKRSSRLPVDGCFGFAGFERTLRMAFDGGTYCLPVSTNNTVLH